MEIRFGDVVIVNLPEYQIGSVQGKKRYAVIIQNDLGNTYGPTTMIVPLTSKIKKLNMPNHKVIHMSDRNGLKKTSMTLGEQTTVVNKTQIENVVGSLDLQETQKVVDSYLANLPKQVAMA